MNSGYYAACTGLATRMQALDTIANNLANTSTVAFRATHNVFSSLLATAGESALSVVNQDANDYGIMSATRLDQAQGSLVPTHNDLDLAIDGPGYFAVKTDTGIAYTRSGNFAVSARGQLVTNEGDLVLGEGNTPVTLVAGHVSISADGTISTDGAISGRLNLVEFAPSVQLQSVGGNYYSAPPKTAVAAKTSMVRQGMLENSNVNPVTGAIELITAQREVETMRHVLTLFSTDMDKTAAQDLPHIGS